METASKLSIKNPKNEVTIDYLNSIKPTIKDTLSGGKYRPYTAHDIDVNVDTITINGSKITKKAQTKILKYLGLAPTYKNVSSKMDPIDWINIADKFCDVLSSTNFYASSTSRFETTNELDSDGNAIEAKEVFEIDEVLLPSPKNDPSKMASLLETMTEQTADSYTNTVVDFLISKISQHDSEIKLHKNTTDLKNKGSVILNFTIEDYKMNVFSSGLDEWTKGVSLNFNKHEFEMNPFFNRLVCTNGAMSPMYGFTTNVHKNNFTTSKIEKTISNGFNNNLILDAILFERIQDMQDFNLSVSELHDFANVFIEEIEKEDFSKNKYLGQMFDDSYLTVAYGMPISDMPAKVKTTADSGKNAYRFFNDITWLASHRQESNISSNLCRKLQIHAGNFLFKKQFDLSQIAPKPTFTNINYISN